MRLLLVDDDEVFRERLARAMTKRGYEVEAASNAAGGFETAETFAPEFAVIDLKMPGDSGLTLIPRLKEMFPCIRIVVLTGYGSIATTLEAVRSGAVDYLTKPADADQIHRALQGEKRAPELSVPSLDRVEWEHLQRVLKDCDHNISRTARMLHIDRRSLQRKLAKHPPLR
ncbi:MAG TPA: response regulator [Chthoniobacterales bacterium]